MATEKRLIDANALETHFRTTKIIEVFPYWSDLPFATQCELVKYGKKCKEIILSAPTVDAVEVAHGKWEHVPLNMDPAYFAYKYNLRKKCSVCGYAMPEEYPSFKICPNCGAKMDRGEKVK